MIANDPREASGHDLLAGYVLDALESDEQAAFESHLRGCSSCQVEVTALSDVMSDVAMSSRVVPPPELEVAIIRSVCADTRSVAPERVPAVRASGSRRRLLVAAAAVVIVGVGAIAVVRTVDQSPSVAVAAEAPTQAVMSIAAAPDAHLMPLDLPGADATFVLSMEMDKGGIVATGLAMPANGQVYQLWAVMPDHTMEAAGTFLPDSDGHAAAVLEYSVSSAAGVMVTIEPSSGSTQPSGEILDEVTL